ncbi:MAG: hypothetical protein ACTSQJ_20150 [Promethearchaeota archaeon]
MRQKLEPKLLSKYESKVYEREKKPFNCIIKEGLERISFNCSNRPDIMIELDDKNIFIKCKIKNPQRLLTLCENFSRLEKEFKKLPVTQDNFFKLYLKNKKPNLDRCKFYYVDEKELEIDLTENPLDYEVSPIFREIELNYDDFRTQLKNNDNPYRKNILKKARLEKKKKI